MKDKQQHALNNAFISAAANGYNAIVHELLKAGADIHARGDAALILAAEAGLTNTVDYLLLRGADRQNDKALRKAAERGHRETIKLLFEWSEKDNQQKRASKLQSDSGPSFIP